MINLYIIRFLSIGLVTQNIVKYMIFKIYMSFCYLAQSNIQSKIPKEISISTYKGVQPDKQLTLINIIYSCRIKQNSSFKKAFFYNRNFCDFALSFHLLFGRFYYQRIVYRSLDAAKESVRPASEIDRQTSLYIYVLVDACTCRTQHVHKQKHTPLQ